MTLLWVSWLALATLVVVLRSILGIRGLASEVDVRTIPDDRALEAAARAAKVGAEMVSEACRQASRAHAAGQRPSASHLFDCARVGARALACDLRRALANWGKSTWTLDMADPIETMDPSTFGRADLRLLAWLEGQGRFVLVGDVVRLRLRLFVLGLQISLLMAAFERMKAPVETGQWTALRDLSSDFARVTDHALQANRALRHLAALSAADLPLAI